MSEKQIAKALAEVLFDDESALIRFDMSEYAWKNLRLVAQRCPSRLCGLRRRRRVDRESPQQTVFGSLFDEVESPPRYFQCPLQVLIVLTDSKGRRLTSPHHYIMTSNLGSKQSSMIRQLALVPKISALIRLV